MTMWISRNRSMSKTFGKRLPMRTGWTTPKSQTATFLIGSDSQHGNGGCEPPFSLLPAQIETDSKGVVGTWNES
jgi:hypothetical protein